MGKLAKQKTPHLSNRTYMFDIQARPIPSMNFYFLQTANNTIFLVTLLRILYEHKRPYMQEANKRIFFKNQFHYFVRWIEYAILKLSFPLAQIISLCSFAHLCHPFTEQTLKNHSKTHNFMCVRKHTKSTRKDR